MNRTAVLVAGAAFLVAGLLGVALLVQPPSDPVASEYGYSVTLATNATLSNVTLYLPVPVQDGDSPFDAVFAGEAGNASVPDGWEASVVETDHGPMLRLTAATVEARIQDDGRSYATHSLSASRPADHDIDTVDPFESEPLLGPASGFETVPCPNQGPDPSDAECHVFESRLYASYDAPAGAAVDVFVVFGGSNDLGGNRGTWYSERVITRLDGAQDGWVEVGGDLQTGAGSA